MKVALIDYGAGNLKSVSNALEQLGADVIVSKIKSEIQSADKVIFPGVGHAEYAMQNLVLADLHDFIPTLTQPVLGVCLGFQLMCTHTEEGNTHGLNIFPAQVKAFPEGEIKIPHMGWNKVEAESVGLFKGIATEYFYHVHSYYVEVNALQIARCDYSLPFATAMKKDNFYGVQFHPEKSASVGEKLLQNFLEL